jgi:hypothetical protein
MADTSLGNSVDSLVPHRSFQSIPRNHSMSNAKGIDTIRLRQLGALAQNLCLQANQQRERQHYIVSHALYGRALEVAQKINHSESNQNGTSLVTRIQKERQAVYELLCRDHGSLEKALLATAHKVGL